MGLQFAVDVVALEQDRARARVLRQDQVRLLQDLDRAIGHILQVADRGRDDVQQSGHYLLSLRRTAIMKR